MSDLCIALYLLVAIPTVIWISYLLDEKYNGDK